MYRIIIILILLIILYFLLRRLPGVWDSNQERLPKPKDQMVQDPVCRVFVPRGSAVTEVIGGQTYCFCSQAAQQPFKGR